MDTREKRKIVCRPATEDEVDTFLRLWQDLSWEPDANYPAAMYRAVRASGFRVICIPNKALDAELGTPTTTSRLRSDDSKSGPGNSSAPSQKEEAIGCILAWSYANTGFIGYFSLLKRYQNKGLGKLLLQDAMNYLHAEGCTSIGLDAVPAAFKLYEKFGFISSGKRVTWFYLETKHWQIDSSQASEEHSECIASLRIISTDDKKGIDSFLALDKEITGFERETIVKELLKTHGWHLFSLSASVGPGDVDDAHSDRMAFAATRPIPNGHAIGPLYSATYEDAQVLLSGITTWHSARQKTVENSSPNKGHMQFAVEAWSDNNDAHRLFHEAGWREDSHYYNRMWLGEEPEAQKRQEHRIYTVLDSGLG